MAPKCPLDYYGACFHYYVSPSCKFATDHSLHLDYGFFVAIKDILEFLKFVMEDYFGQVLSVFDEP